MSEVAREVPRGESRTSLSFAHAARVISDFPRRVRALRPSLSGTNLSKAFVRLRPASWAGLWNGKQRSHAGPSPSADLRLLRNLAEVRRLLSHVYTFPYPILDRDRVRGSLRVSLNRMQAGDPRGTAEELEDLRGYLLTRLIIAEMALTDPEPHPRGVRKDWDIADVWLYE